jgi:hypothetical protein
MGREVEQLLEDGETTGTQRMKLAIMALMTTEEDVVEVQVAAA